MYCRHIFFTQFAGRELLGVGVGVGGVVAIPSLQMGEPSQNYMKMQMQKGSKKEESKVWGMGMKHLL